MRSDEIRTRETRSEIIGAGGAGGKMPSWTSKLLSPWARIMALARTNIAKITKIQFALRLLRSLLRKMKYMMIHAITAKKKSI